MAATYSRAIWQEAAPSRAWKTLLWPAGKKPLDLGGGLQRIWLEDGDEIILRGRAEALGWRSIGFGECRRRIAPAVAWPGSAVQTFS